MMTILKAVVKAVRLVWIGLMSIEFFTSVIRRGNFMLLESYGYAGDPEHSDLGENRGHSCRTGCSEFLNSSGGPGDQESTGETGGLVHCPGKLHR